MRFSSKFTFLEHCKKSEWKILSTPIGLIRTFFMIKLQEYNQFIMRKMTKNRIRTVRLTNKKRN